MLAVGVLVAYPASDVVTGPTSSPGWSLRRAAASRSGCRVATSQYGVGSAGSSIATRTARSQVGPQQQVGAGVGVAPRRPGGCLGVERLGRRRGARPGSGPARRAAPRRPPRPAPRRSRRQQADRRPRRRHRSPPRPATAGIATRNASQHRGQEHRGQHPPAQRDAEPLVVAHGARSLSHARTGHRGGRGRVAAVVRRSSITPTRPRPAAAVVRPPRRRRRRPGHHRRRAPAAGGAGAGADRDRDRAARRGTSRWCTRAPGSRPGSGCRSSTRPGTVDAGYRGEVKVLLVNLDPAEPIDARRGDRIAQLVVQRVETAALRRGRAPARTRPAAPAGYGSTGGFAAPAARRSTPEEQP